MAARPFVPHGLRGRRLMVVRPGIMAGQRWRGMTDGWPDPAGQTVQVDARRRGLHWRRLAAAAAERERHDRGQRAEVKRFHDIAPAKFRRRAIPLKSLCVPGVLVTISSEKR
jgi:hypothetical protein